MSDTIIDTEADTEGTGTQTAIVDTVAAIDVATTAMTALIEMVITATINT